MAESPRDPTTSALPANDTLLMEALKRARAGDQIAFEILYYHWSRPVWRRLMHLVVNEEITADLHQETWIKAWIGLLEIQGELQFGPWIFRIAANTAIDYFRHRKKIIFLPFPEGAAEEHSSVNYLSVPGPEEQICDRKCLEQALAEVAPQCRICLLLQDQWGFSQREIAEILSISVNSVGAYIFRGREQARQAYQRLEHESFIRRKEGRTQ